MLCLSPRCGYPEKNAKRRLPREAETASNRGVKDLSIIYVARRTAQAALSGCLMAGLIHGQATTNPPSSSSIAETAETIRPGANPASRSAAVNGENGVVVDPASLLPDLPPVPKAKVTLMGGTVSNLDRVRDQVKLNIFGGGKALVLFDPRTQIYVGTKPGSITDLRPGQRVYLDTILDGSTVFARTIRISAAGATGQSQGTVSRLSADQLTLRDGLSPADIQVRITSATKFTQAGHEVPASTLTQGSLVNLTFAPEDARHNAAREVQILALRGSRFTFVGEVVHIDLRNGLLVLNSPIDKKSYEIYMSPSAVPDENLHTGSDVTVVATFEGSRYTADTIKIDSTTK